jgi:hypothetical protein
MILINFSSPLGQDQLKQAESLLREPVGQVINFSFQLDSDQLILPQFRTAMKKFPISAEVIRNEPVAVILPSANYLAALILAELHAWMDYFPTILRIRIQPYSLPPRHEVAELLDLQETEDSARGTD